MKLTMPAAAVALYNQGWSARLIAREAGLTAGEVRRLLVKGGVDGKTVSAGSGGWPGMPQRPRGYVAPFEDAIRKLRKQRMSDKKIAETLGIDKTTCWRFRLDHKIP